MRIKLANGLINFFLFCCNWSIFRASHHRARSAQMNRKQFINYSGIKYLFVTAAPVGEQSSNYVLPLLLCLASCALRINPFSLEVRILIIHSHYVLTVRNYSKNNKLFMSIYHVITLHVCQLNVAIKWNCY